MIRRTSHALSTTPVESLDDHVAGGGMSGLSTARSLDPDAVIDRIGTAGVRGRGGAGFPTAVKWKSLATERTDADLGTVVINAAEGEPGTFKDRPILRTNPYLVLEGALIAAHCLRAEVITVATKARFAAELDRVRHAIAEIDEAGWSAGVRFTVVEGPDHYLFGEETALLEVIEGEDPLPRHLPPYHYGVFTTSPQMGWSAGIDASPGGPTEASDNPTLVNNVETYAHAALVLRHGPDWYRSMGTEQSAGPTIVTISGDVEREVVAEIELGQSLRDVIVELAGGATSGHSIKAVLSGVSNPVLTADHLDTPIGYETLQAAGSGLGSAGFMVFDDRRNMVDVAYQVSRFLHVESCGQCNPCKLGTHDITAALEQLVLGTAVASDVIATIERRLTTVTDGSRCFLPSQERNVIPSLLERFPDDLAERLAGVPGDPDVPLPKIVDIVDGAVVTDPTSTWKRPDWTYGETSVRLTV